MNVHVLTARNEQTGNKAVITVFESQEEAYAEMDRLNEQEGGGWTDARVYHKVLQEA